MSAIIDDKVTVDGITVNSKLLDFMNSNRPTKKKSIFWAYINEIELMANRGYSAKAICECLRKELNAGREANEKNLWQFLCAAEKRKKREEEEKYEPELIYTAIKHIRETEMIRSAPARKVVTMEEISRRDQASLQPKQDDAVFPASTKTWQPPESLTKKKEANERSAATSINDKLLEAVTGKPGGANPSLELANIQEQMR